SYLHPAIPAARATWQQRPVMAAEPTELYPKRVLLRHPHSYGGRKFPRPPHFFLQIKEAAASSYQGDGGTAPTRSRGRALPRRPFGCLPETRHSQAIDESPCEIDVMLDVAQSRYRGVRKHRLCPRWRRTLYMASARRGSLRQRGRRINPQYSPSNRHSRK